MYLQTPAHVPPAPAVPGMCSTMSPLPNATFVICGSTRNAKMYLSLCIDASPHYQLSGSVRRASSHPWLMTSFDPLSSTEPYVPHHHRQLYQVVLRPASGERHRQQSPFARQLRVWHSCRAKSAQLESRLQSRLVFQRLLPKEQPS